MEMYRVNKLYKTGVNGVDEFGVDHSNFSLRDELEYNMKIANEKQNNAANNTGIQYAQNEYTNTANNPNCYMTFDGKNLSLYNNSGEVDNLDAMSGHPDYQSAQYQNIANKGPIPEGTYYANQDQRQSLTWKNAALKAVEKATSFLGIDTEPKSTWSGNPYSWGRSRVWLQPDENTNTYGRSGFTIHGGATKGSRGCIDIPWQTDRLSNYLDNCQDSVPVNVKYPKNW